MEYRRFTKNDWMGYAGATNFLDGSEPLIGNLVVTDWPEGYSDMEVIMTGADSGPGIYVTVEGLDRYMLMELPAKGMGEILLQSLPDQITVSELEALGFEWSE